MFFKSREITFVQHEFQLKRTIRIEGEGERTSLTRTNALLLRFIPVIMSLERGEAKGIFNEKM